MIPAGVHTALQAMRTSDATGHGLTAPIVRSACLVAWSIIGLWMTQDAWSGWMVPCLVLGSAGIIGIMRSASYAMALCAVTTGLLMTAIMMMTTHPMLTVIMGFLCLAACVYSPTPCIASQRLNHVKPMTVIRHTHWEIAMTGSMSVIIITLMHAPDAAPAATWMMGTTPVRAYPVDGPLDMLWQAWMILWCGSACIVLGRMLMAEPSIMHEAWLSDDHERMADICIHGRRHPDEISRVERTSGSPGTIRRNDAFMDRVAMAMLVRWESMSTFTEHHRTIFPWVMARTMHHDPVRVASMAVRMDDGQA
jgi:hypothetical protein